MTSILDYGGYFFHSPWQTDYEGNKHLRYFLFLFYPVSKKHLEKNPKLEVTSQMHTSFIWKVYEL